MQTLPSQNARSAPARARTAVPPRTPLVPLLHHRPGPAARAVVKVLVCESHELYRIGLRTVLESSRGLMVAGEAATAAGALELAAGLRPDVVLAGDPGPGACVPELVGALCRLRARPVVLTEKPTDVPALLLAGARGCLPRLARPDRIRDAVRAAACGDAVLGAEAVDVVLGLLGRPAPDTTPGSPVTDVPADAPAGLTPRQWEVARLVAEGCSNAEIAACLHVGEATVKSHLVSVLRKLGLRDRTQLAIRLIRSHAG
ncbi:response regulator transcription factor [Streptomyces sp. NPDC048191]|uniref:response regulator transcription factor n=1 Tax=Streptomyces sp. NPDC048191 TaxID=3155484 RepID=UPI0033C33ACE